MRVHIVGAGLIGGKRAAALRPDDVIVDIVDPDQGRAAALRQQHPGPGDADPRARDGDIAIVATTHDQLVPAALPYAQAGCHLLVEKPGARNLQEFSSLARAVHPDRIVAVGYNHRFHPALLRLKEIATDQRFGPLRSIRARYGHGGRPGYDQEWRADKVKSGGGELLDQGSHLIDLTRFIAGDFALTHAELATLFWQMPVEDNAWLLGDIPGNPTGQGKASLHASWTEWKNLFSFEVSFTTAKVDVRGLGGSYGPETLIEHHMERGFGPPTTTSIEFPPGDASWSREWADITGRIEGRAGLGATGADAEAVLTVIAEAYRHAHH